MNSVSNQRAGIFALSNELLLMIINEADDTGDLIRLSQCNRLFHGLANQRVIFRKDVELLKQISDWESIDWERLFPDDDFEEEDSDRKRPLPGNHRQFALDNYKRGLYYEERIDNAHEEARSRASPWPICTPLLFCAVAGDVEFKVIRDIVDMYVDIWPEGLDEHQGIELLTPLQLATLGRRHDVMQLLLDRGSHGNSGFDLDYDPLVEALAADTEENDDEGENLALTLLERGFLPDEGHIELAAGTGRSATMLRIIDITDVVMDDDLFTHLMFEAVADNEWKSGPARDNNFAVIDALVASNDGEAPTPGDALDLLTYVFDAGNLGNAQHLVALTGLGWEDLKELGPRYFLWDERLSFTKYVLGHCLRTESDDSDDLTSMSRQKCAEALLAATLLSGDRCKDDKGGECEMRRQRPKERTIAYLLDYVTSDAEHIVSCAAQSGRPQYIDLVVTHCLKHGIPWDLGDDSEIMPLEYALGDQTWPCVFRLLHYGADPTRVETTSYQSFQQHVRPLVGKLKVQIKLISGGGDGQIAADDAVAAAEYMETIDGLASLLQERIATGMYSSSSGDLRSIFSIQECDIEGEVCLSTQHPTHLLARDVPMAQKCALLKLLTDGSGRRLEELISRFWRPSLRCE